MLAKQGGVLSGGDVVRAVYRQLDRTAKVRLLVKDGVHFKAGEILAEIEAPFSTLFSGERTALNFVQQLSGVATMTRAFVDALGAGARMGVYDTRKTTPLLRSLEKRAVVHGGGRNHRMGLYDMAMLKNNHIDAAGGVAEAMARLRATAAFRKNPRIPVCIEARDVKEALAAVAERAQIVMLDNMDSKRISDTVKEIRSFAKQRRLPVPQIEISGGITLERMKEVRRLPIDRVSVGALTHSAPAVDISLRIDPPKPDAGNKRRTK